MSALPTGLYRHIKGNHYYVYGTAVHTETRETMVIYAAESGDNEVWVRPITMFTEMVETRQGTVPRFSFVGEKHAITNE